jgi:hypothetical protein
MPPTPERPDGAENISFVARKREIGFRNVHVPLLATPISTQDFAKLWPSDPASQSALVDSKVNRDQTDRI